ncbi:hypothetical protein JZ751_016192 [Albula glossodonta]|uniref:Fucolectin tachylectin-4 pentraxin-1 domain-containing protein n=1 Tax=Albula glossodonta TaxID=121402 RepID=A0A8T2MUM5_9TELE|nr:hypothetical protein JZ751_016192 [Albula glossodonta]
MKMKTMIVILQILTISLLLPPGSNGLVNVAVRGTATQSAIYSANHAAGLCDASNAIDGNRDANALHGSCTHSTNVPNPWWRVDLLKPYKIHSVTITNRGDCCPNRINGAEIHIGNSLENNGITNPLCSTIPSINPGPTKTFPCAQPMVGRYVTVYIPRKDFLHLCEVEVNAEEDAEC